MASLHQPVWTLPVEAVYESLATTPQGLSSREAAQRLEQFGANELPTPTHRPLQLKFTDQPPTGVADDRYESRAVTQLIAEVLSPSTKAFDRGEKFGDYQRLNSLKEWRC